MNEENFDEEKQNEKMGYKDFQKRNISSARENWRQANLFGKLWMILLCLIVGGGIIALFILFFMNLFVVMGIVIGALLVFIPLVILVAYLVGKARTNKKNIDWDIPAREGVVLSCVLHTEASNLKNVKRDSGEVEIISSIFKLKVKVDGEEKIVYDDKSHEVGEKVSLRAHKRFKKILFVE